MKTTSTLILLLFAALVNAHAELRTFTSSDGQRTFQGAFVGYNSITKVVTVRNEQGQTMHFNIELISKKDQEFVKSNPGKARAAVEVKFDPQMDQANAERTTEKRVTTYDAGYKILLHSFTPHDLNDVEVDYLKIYRKADVKEGAETLTVRGSAKVNKIVANGTHEIETEPVKLINFYMRPQVISRNTCKGTVTYSQPQRSRDTLVGCIARVKVNGQVVKTSASAPNLLRKYEQELDSAY